MHIMQNRRVPHLALPALRPSACTAVRVATGGACLLLLALPVAPMRAAAQAPAGGPPPLDPTYTPTLTFDLASIRETAGVTEGRLRVGVVSPPHASKFEATNFSVNALLQLAYGYGTPIANAPAWVHERYFNVQARADAAADAKLAKLNEDDARMEKQHMIEALLTERLNLKFHWETRESSVYALVVAKGGSKLEEVKETKPDPAAGPPDPDHPALAGAQGTDIKAAGGPRGLEFTAERTSTRAIAAILVSQINTPVLDRTGLNGSYKFTLQMGRDWSANNPEAWPDIYTAVQEQLGLKLESTKAAIPVLVLDHIDPPSAN